MREPPLTLGFDDEGPDPFEDEDRPSDRAAPPATGTAQGFVVRTDGAARGNPGPASAGAVLLSLARPDARDPRAEPDASISDYLGIQTNNVAEYTATVRAIALALELGARRLELLLDSMLIVEQLNGRIGRLRTAAPARPVDGEGGDLLFLRAALDDGTNDHAGNDTNGT